MSPLISLLLTVYNGAETLQNCLDHIGLQENVNFELIVVDDGSEDETGKILRAFQAKDARVQIINPGRVGVVEAQNIGLKACRGDYIARIDADDLMRPRRLKTQLDFMLNHQEVDLCGTQCIPYGVDREIMQGLRDYHDWQNNLLTHEEISSAIFVEASISHPTFFGKKEVFNQGYLDNPWIDDYDFLLRAFLKGFVFGKVPEILVEKGDRENSITRKDPRCTREAFATAKAHYLMQTSWVKGRGIVIMGSGPNGRLALKVLTKEGSKPVEIIDNKAGPPGRTIQGIPSRGFPEGVSEKVVETLGDVYLVLCVGEEKERDKLIQHIKKTGRKWGVDYVRLI